MIVLCDRCEGRVEHVRPWKGCRWRTWRCAVHGWRPAGAVRPVREVSMTVTLVPEVREVVVCGVVR